MTGFGKFGVFLFSALLTCLFLLAGCNGNRTETSEDNQVGEAPTQDRRSVLQAELDRKFENPDAHFELGMLYQAEGRWDRAAYHYDVALNFDPVFRAAQAAKVKVLLDSGATAKADEQARIYMKKVEESAEDSLLLGKTFGRQGLEQYALACYRQSLGISPESAEAHKLIGYYYLGKGDKEQAREYLSRSFKLNPTQADVAEELGRLGIEVRVPKAPKESVETPEKSAEPPAESGQ